MTLETVYGELLEMLHSIYDPRESAQIADMVVEHITGLKKSERIINRNLPISDEQVRQFTGFRHRLQTHEPIQYVLGAAWFMGLPLLVSEAVLIPRPETEELAEWILVEIRDIVTADPHQASLWVDKKQSLLDIGTGSGCIAVALKRHLPHLDVYAMDISMHALAVARKNAEKFEAPIKFIQSDILDEGTWGNCKMFDIIVSNPPYIQRKEAGEMRRNVLDHEPHLALFVEDDDPLLFYRKIAKFSERHLSSHGFLFFEINELSGQEMIQLLERHGFGKIQIKKDFSGKERMIKAQR